MQHRTYRQDGPAEAMARGLGWFSIGLGLAELLVPQALGRALGMERHTHLLQVYGVREIATGVGILAAGDPTPWVWGRVAGDALDLATLAPAMSETNPQRANVGLAIGAVALAAILDIYCAQRLARREPVPLADYSGRSGFPQPAERMRGAALQG